MKCKEALNSLDEYFDSNNDKNIKLKIQNHLKTCLNCNNEFKIHNSMLQLLKSLPDSINPPKNHWKYIKNGIKKNKKNVFYQYPKLSFVTITLSILLLFTIVYFSIIKKNINNNSIILTEFNIAKTEYNNAKKKLLSTIKNKKKYLNENTIQSIEVNLMIIDEAINEITIALKNNPSNQMLAMQLANTYQKQINLILKTNQNISTIKN